MNRLMASIILLTILHLNFMKTYGQQPGEFLIRIDDQQVDIVLLDSEKREIFGVTVQKNGGISELRIPQIPYAFTLGYYVWDGDGPQSTGSNMTAEPIIENKGEYVTLTCYGRYNTHQLSVITNITISKKGLIVFSSRLVAERNEPTLMMIAWDSFIPLDLFAGEKVYRCVRGRVQEAILPVNFGSNPVFSQRDFQWIDFSKTLEGVTFVNMAPDFNYEGTLQDEREWNGTAYSFRYVIRGWGQSSMEQGEEVYTKVAICVHGPGGYQSSLELIDLLLSFADLEARVRNSASFKSERARELASQACVPINTAFNKLLNGGLISAKDTLKQAEQLIREAEEIEMFPQLMRDIGLAAFFIILIAILYIFRRHRLSLLKEASKGNR
jgi:cbb3-type cytochrome oxidase subunit 3